jgi:hypothetical protein
MPLVTRIEKKEKHVGEARAQDILHFKYWWEILKKI